MRLAVLGAGVIVALTTPADACPPREACVVAMHSTVREHAPTGATAPLRRALELPVATVRRVPGVQEPVEMPWIWRALRDQVYARMPTYEDRKDDFKIVLAPVVVTSPSDTVPGVGIAGDF